MAEKIILRTDKLAKSFENGQTKVEALKDVNLEIREGEIFGIIGLSGAGKSTLIRCLNLLEKPTSGAVFFREENLAELDAKDLLALRRKIGMIFQDFNLLQQRTALENVTFPLEISGSDKKYARQKAEELLSLVGLPDKLGAYPSQLSGGQQQRVAIARSLATEPEILLCDEVTSALDPTTTDQILDLLKEINRRLNVTIILITHAMDVVTKICDRVAVMEASEIVELGLVSEVFMHPQSKVARQLIIPRGELLDKVESEKTIRITFDGRSAYEPIVANMVLTCQTPVSILSADSKNIEGKSYGQMLIQVPDDQAAWDRIIGYLEQNKISYKQEGI